MSRQSANARLETEIQKIKQRLLNKVKTYGMYENFGQKEVRKLRDKHNFVSIVYGTDKERADADAIIAFGNWATDYTGE